MYHYDYLTEKTCSNVISLDLDGDRVHNFSKILIFTSKKVIMI